MKILLIEDNLSISKGLEYTFNGLNYEIINKTNTLPSYLTFF